MAGYLAERGVPAGAVIEDHCGDETWATARHTAALSPASVVVVMQWFPLPRATLALRRCGLTRVSGGVATFCRAAQPVFLRA